MAYINLSQLNQRLGSSWRYIQLFYTYVFGHFISFFQNCSNFRSS